MKIVRRVRQQRMKSRCRRVRQCDTIDSALGVAVVRQRIHTGVALRVRQRTKVRCRRVRQCDCDTYI